MAARSRTATSTATRCRIDSSIIFSSISGGLSVIVACAGLFDVGLDDVAVLGGVNRARLDAADHLGPFRPLLAEFEQPHFIGLADLGKDHAEIAELLDRVGPDCQR